MVAGLSDPASKKAATEARVRRTQLARRGGVTCACFGRSCYRSELHLKGYEAPNGCPFVNHDADKKLYVVGGLYYLLLLYLNPVPDSVSWVLVGGGAK